MNINLISQKNIGFRNHKTNEIFTVHPKEPTMVPAWVRNDPMYEWAMASGDLQDLTAEAEKEIEKAKIAQAKKEEAKRLKDAKKQEEKGAKETAKSK